MRKADIAQTTSRDESDFEAALRSDFIKAGTRPTFLGRSRTHQCVSFLASRCGSGKPF